MEEEKWRVESLSQEDVIAEFKVNERLKELRGMWTL